MLDFTGAYQPPGVYIQEQTPAIIATPVTSPNIVALVGPARGYWTTTDALVLNGTTAVPLTQLGINDATITVTDAYGNVYASSNYTVTQTGSPAYATTTTIKLTAGGVTAIGSQVVYIAYQYTPATYFQPQTFTSYNDVVTAFGPAFDANNNLISPITLAAQIVYANGSPTIIAVPSFTLSGTTYTPDAVTLATRTGLSTAYALLDSNPAVSIIVPLPVGITGTPTTIGDIYNVGTDLATHCTTLSQQGVYRTGIYGFETSVTITPDVVATNIGSSRCDVAYPNQLNFYNGATNSTVVIGGHFLAAAYAGMLASYSVQQGLTRQTVAGFSGIPNSMFISMTRQNKNTWSAAGASVAEISGNGALVCRQGVTTNVTSVTAREISVIRALDSMMYQLETTLNQSGIIGSPTTPTTAAQIQTVAQSVLDNLTSTGVIIGYTSLSAGITSTNPTVVTVTFAVQPAYPLNYIGISFSVDTTTGAVTTS